MTVKNAGTATANLDDFGFPNANNGADTLGGHDFWNDFTAGATLAPGGEYVIAHPSADAQILDQADQTHQYLSNGDDGYCLVYGTESNYIKVDCIGDYQADPGSGWAVCNVSEGTKDHTLVRKDSVTQGNAGNWTTSAGTTAEDCEWIVMEKDDWSCVKTPCSGASDADSTTTTTDSTPLEVPSGVSLLFSSYAEGSSNNKYMTVKNAGTATANLDDFGFPNANNGADTLGGHDFWNDFTAGATLAPGGEYVIAHPSADAQILDQADQTHQYLSNGDDGYCLVYGTESNYIKVDCIGDYQADPGSGWAVCNVSEGTKDHTLVRKDSVTQGNAGNWTTSAGTTAEDCEWIVMEKDEWRCVRTPCSGVSSSTTSQLAAIPGSPVTLLEGSDEDTSTTDVSEANGSLFLRLSGASATLLLFAIFA